MLKLHIVQAEFGDCFLLEYGTPEDRKFLLIDGGPQNIYSTYLQGELQRITDAGGRLELVVLSHVDEDHILGLLDLLGELRHKRAQGSPETIEIGGLWHNTFSETVGQDVEERFRSVIRERDLARPPASQKEIERHVDLERRSIAQGDDLTKATAELDLAINPHFAPNKLICLEDAPQPIELDNLSLRIVGPTQENLKRLRRKWLAWIRKHQKALQILNTEEADRALRELDRSVPNLSSIMFLVEADGRKILFTGDGRGDHLLDGLEKAGLLDAEGRMHIDVLKVPHHGSMRNVSEKFFKAVTADQYVISADGKHGNPDLKTLQWIVTAAKNQGRQIEIVVTNETESTRQLQAEFAPHEWGYNLIWMDPETHTAIVDLESGTVEFTRPHQQVVEVVESHNGGKAMSKKALLVGINNFTRPDWALRGCINDTGEMQSLLKTYFGFQDDNIKILNDRDATHQGIRDGLDWLLSDYAGGDVRVFHFSSHGTQVDDQSDEEWEALDEVIVPYDHSWSNPFRDDDLRVIFDRIPDDVNFTFIADCCHSGSIQKVLLDQEIDFRPRYLTPPAEVIERIESRKLQREAEADAYAAAKLQEMLEGVPRSQWAEKIPEFLAFLRRRFAENRYGVVAFDKHVLLAGCEDRQTSADAFIDGMYRGAFTWAMSKAIREAGGDLIYDDLIRLAGENLKDYDQKPQLECPVELRTAKIFSPLN